MSNAEKRRRQKAGTQRAREERERAQRAARRKRLAVRVVVGGVIVIGLLLALSLIGEDETDEAAESTTTLPVTTTGAPTTTTTAPLVEGCVDTVPETPVPRTDYEAPELTIDPATSYTAVVDTTCGAFTIELAAAEAPETVNSFVFLAREGFYDGLTFHRAVEGFVIQGGDPLGDGTGGPGYSTADEPPADGYRQGTVAIANSGPGTSGSQFFVTLTDDAGDRLEALGGPPYGFSVLGQVTDGFDAVERLASYAQPDESVGRPLYILSVEITES